MMSDFAANGVKGFTAQATAVLRANSIGSLTAKPAFTVQPILLYTQAGIVLEAQNGYFLEDQPSPYGTPDTADSIRSFTAT